MGSLYIHTRVYANILKKDVFPLTQIHQILKQKMSHFGRLFKAKLALIQLRGKPSL